MTNRYFKACGKPNPRSLRGQMLKYFHDNPDEELMPADIRTKFGASPRNVESTLWRMRQAGEIWCGYVVRGKR